jgi:2-polyprenyl-3-methyl-5-hydroxy-6-metoxy-1,4-benzoquinol methylase
MNLNFNRLSYFTQMDAEALHRRAHFVMSALTVGYRYIPFPKSAPWDISDERSFGHEDIYNTILAVNQLAHLIATSSHPAVSWLVEYSKKNSWPGLTEAQNCEALSILIDSKVLSGQRTLDLGCGVTPMFARTARAMGARVWTVDVLPHVAFAPYRAGYNQDYAQQERAGHIQLNFNSPAAAQTVLARTAGQCFHFISSAHPMIMNGCSGYEYPKPKFLEALLEEGGVYFDARPFAQNEGFQFKSVGTAPLPVVR